jgi:TonB family protein
VLRLNSLLVGFIIFSASARLLADDPELHPVPSSGVVEPSSASLVLELDRAILVLKRGIKEKWDTRDQYLAAFERTPDAGSTTQSVTKAKKYIDCAMSARLRIHKAWDEGLPIGVEAQRTITEFTRWRKDADAELPLPSCPVSLPRKVRVSAGVAAGMLKTRVAPVYPDDVHISGMVILRAVIDDMGRVKSLSVVSGPVMLQQSALEAVEKWTFRPYLLNDVPVEFETTINVVFALRH